MPKRHEHDQQKTQRFLPCPTPTQPHRGTCTRQKHLLESNASFHNNFLVFQGRKLTDSLSQCLRSLHSVTVYAFLHLGEFRMTLTTLQ